MKICNKVNNIKSPGGVSTIAKSAILTGLTIILLRFYRFGG